MARSDKRDPFADRDQVHAKLVDFSFIEAARLIRKR